MRVYEMVTYNAGYRDISGSIFIGEVKFQGKKTDISGMDKVGKDVSETGLGLRLG